MGMPAVHAVVLINRTTKPDLIGRFGALKFPHVLLGQPVFRVFDLPTVIKALAEQPVLVPNTIAHGWNSER